MIVYVASYPRSGNYWVLQLLQDRFRYLMSDIHGEPATARSVFEQYKQLSEEDGFEFLHQPAANLGDPYVRYRSIVPENRERLLLVPGSQKHLEDEGLRRHLAGLENRFILKTHLPPYQRYFRGERVVQPVRHPGAALWSYYHFLNDVMGHEVSLETVIEGAVGFGCWSGYHQAWDAVADKLGDRLLRVRYESLFDGEEEFCHRLSTLTGLPIQSENNRPFAFYHQRFPQLARCGKPDDWKRHFSTKQFRLLAERHKVQMQRLGYPVSTEA